MIDVLIRTFNSEKTIERCIDSVYLQTLKKYRIIVSDDCSEDDTVRIIKEKYPKVEIHVNKERVGAGLNRKLLVSYSTSKYLTFLDADDFIDENYLEVMFNKMLSTNSDVIKCCKRIFTDKGIVKDSGDIWGMYKSKQDIIKVLSTDFMSNYLFKRKMFDGIEWFDKKNCEDGSILIQLANNIKVLYQTKMTFYNWYRKGNNGISSNKDSIIWHLNCLHSKLLRLKIWQDNNIPLFSTSTQLIENFYGCIADYSTDKKECEKTLSYISKLGYDIDLSSYFIEEPTNKEIKKEVKFSSSIKTKKKRKKNKGFKGLKVALCAIAKNENFYIREWVKYYQKLGINKIFLYDNNEIEGECFDDVIGDYIKSGYVEIIDVRGVEKGKAYNSDGLNLQPSCYYDCYENKLAGFDWCCFFDIDEFLDFRNNYNLQKYLKDDIFNETDTILVGWTHYNDNGLIHFDERPVIERFPIESKMTYHVPKSIVRCGKTPIRKNEDNVIHFFRVEGERISMADGTPFTKHGNWLVYDDNSTHNCFLRHYKTKTIEEFIRRHLNRFWGTSKTFTGHKRTYYDIIREFFKYNDITKEKIEYITQGLKIIAITSWERRIKYLQTCISNIREKCGDQYKIVITLSTDEFPNKEDDLPYGLIKFINSDVDTEIIWVKRNYKPFKKILFAMEKYPYAPIISADDDCFYKYNYADELYDEWIKEPDKVVTSERFYEYEIDGKKIPFAHGRCTIYPPSCILEYKRFIENDNILSTNNDDSFYGICLFRKSIKIKYLKHLDEDIADFITNDYSLTMNGGTTPESLKLKYFRDKKTIISELDKTNGKIQQIIKYK